MSDQEDDASDDNYGGLDVLLLVHLKETFRKIIEAVYDRQLADVLARFDGVFTTDNSAYWQDTSTGLDHLLEEIYKVPTKRAKGPSDSSVTRQKLDRAQDQLIAYHNHGDSTHVRNVLVEMFMEQVDVNTASDEQLREIFQEIKACRSSGVFLSKLAFFAEGDLYKKISVRLGDGDQMWMARLAELFNVNRSRVWRAVTFFKVVSLFPGLLVCDLSLTWILKRRKDILKNLNNRPAAMNALWSAQIRPTEMFVHGTVHAWVPLSPEERETSFKSLVDDRSTAYVPIDPIEENVPDLFETDVVYVDPTFAFWLNVALDYLDENPPQDVVLDV